MKKQPLSRTQQVWRIARWILLILGICVLLVMVFDHYGWSTGTRTQITQVGPDAVYTPGKTLWDWLDLLIIPVFLAGGALLVNWNSQKNEQKRANRENEINRQIAERESQTERQIASERNQEAALQTYLDRMTELLLKEGLRDSAPESEVRTVARTRTLTILRSVDSERKNTIIRFLLEARLVSGKPQQEKEPEQKPIISLEGADLHEADLSETNLTGANMAKAKLGKANLSLADLIRADLFQANLTEANMTGAKLSGAILTEADLIGANLLNADLSKADLFQANLSEAKLIGAILIGTNLSWADLRKAELFGASLKGATVSPNQLTQAKSLRSATMPNGEEYDPNIPLEEQCKIPNKSQSTSRGDTW